MLTCKAILPDKLGLFVAKRRLTVDDALDTQHAIIGGQIPGLSLDTPSILDFREVRAADLTAPELMRFVKARRSMVDMPSTGPLAFVCGSRALFGMLRMFSILAEVGGLWKEDIIFVTLDPAQAMEWIAGRADLSEDETCHALESVRDETGWDLTLCEAI